MDFLLFFLPSGFEGPWLSLIVVARFLAIVSRRRPLLTQRYCPPVFLICITVNPVARALLLLYAAEYSIKVVDLVLWKKKLLCGDPQVYFVD